MEQRYVGRSGLQVSELALGTMTWGRDTDIDDAAAQLIAFRDAGGTLVDTAPWPGGGDAEAMLGTLLGTVVAREDVVLAARAGLTRVGDSQTVDASRGALLRRLDDSLTALGVDYLDLWQVHSVDVRVPFEETLAALDFAVASGKVRYVGVSNYNGWRLAAAATWQRAVPGRTPLIGNQVEYSLLSRGVEREVVPACLELGIGIFPYAPLGGGVLTGKYRGAVPSGSRLAAARGAVPTHTDARAMGIVEAVATAAEGLGTTPLAVSLSWLRERPAVVAPVIGARTSGQLTAVLQALAVQLPQEIRLALDEVSAPALGYPEVLR